MKTVSIHQPNYLPWLGYFYKIYQSDYFVFLDDAQYSNEGMHNYNYIKTQKGRFRLKIPVIQTLGDTIKEVKTRDNLGWREKHLSIIKTSYSSSQYFNTIFKDLNDLICQEQQVLSELNILIIKFICYRFSINSEFVKSSDFHISERKEERIIRICKELGADTYYSGTGAKAYQNEEKFRQQGIELRYSEFTPFRYDQLWGNFIPNVSVIDYLMNCGYDWNMVISNQNVSTFGNRQFS